MEGFEGSKVWEIQKSWINEGSAEYERGWVVSRFEINVHMTFVQKGRVTVIFEWSSGWGGVYGYVVVWAMLKCCLTVVYAVLLSGLLWLNGKSHIHIVNMKNTTLLLVWNIFISMKVLHTVKTTMHHHKFKSSQSVNPKQAACTTINTQPGSGNSH